MLSIQKQLVCKSGSKYFERLVNLPDGKLALVVFEIVEIDGQLKARAVCGRILENNTEEKIYALPAQIDSISIIPLKKPLFSYKYFTTKDLSFFSSQTTRAPNFA